MAYRVVLAFGLVTVAASGSPRAFSFPEVYPDAAVWSRHRELIDAGVFLEAPDTKPSKQDTEQALVIDLANKPAQPLPVISPVPGEPLVPGDEAKGAVKGAGEESTTKEKVRSVVCRRVF